LPVLQNGYFCHCFPEIKKEYLCRIHSSLVIHAPLSPALPPLGAGACAIVQVLPVFSDLPDTHNGLDTESIALSFQITALDRERFVYRIGMLDGQQWIAIKALIEI